MVTTPGPPDCRLINPGFKGLTNENGVISSAGAPTRLLYRVGSKGPVILTVTFHGPPGTGVGWVLKKLKESPATTVRSVTSKFKESGAAFTLLTSIRTAGTAARSVFVMVNSDPIE